MIRVLAAIFALSFTVSCTQGSANEVWIYTSLYKDTISDIKPKLEAQFPEVDFKFYQAGSEEIAAKVNAETLAGGTRADILISSDRFWYEELAKNNKLHPYNTERVKSIPQSLRHADGLYNTLSIPVMVLAYNNDAMKGARAPQSFKEMVEKGWRGKFTTGSPLSSGTNFTTVAFLSKAYGWDFFKKLSDNKTISEGGNSAVIRRIQNKERPVGWVLLENILRFQGKDERLKTVFPTDGVIMHNNVLAITKKTGDRSKTEAVAAWLFSQSGQEAMLRSYMYSPFSEMPPPKGAPKFSELQQSSFRWTPEFVAYVVENRDQIKEKFAEIMFN